MANDNEGIPNPALRAHVTDHSFVLTVRKSHIAAMIQIASGKRAERNVTSIHTPDTFVTAMHGLGRRGLVEHRHRPNFAGKSLMSENEPITNYYRLTRAGWAVYDLLEEAGMVPLIARNSAHRRKVA